MTRVFSTLRGVFALDPALQAEEVRDKKSVCPDDVNHSDMSDENSLNDSEKSGSSKAVDGYGPPAEPVIEKRKLEAAALGRIVDRTGEQESRFRRVENWLNDIKGNHPNPERKPYDNAAYFVVGDEEETHPREVERGEWDKRGDLRRYFNHLGDKTRPPPEYLRKIIQRVKMRVNIGPPDERVEEMPTGNTVFTTQDPNPVLFTVTGPHGIEKSDSFVIQPLNSTKDWKIVSTESGPEFRLDVPFFACIEDGMSIMEDDDEKMPKFNAKWEGWFHAHYDQVTGPVWVWPADGHIYIYIELPESQYCTIEKCQDDGVDYSLVIPGISAGNSHEEYSIWIRHAGVNPEERGLSPCDSMHDSDGDHDSGDFNALEQKYAKKPEERVVVPGRRYDNDSMQSVNSADIGSVSAGEGERSSSSGDWTGDSADGDASDDASAQDSDRRRARNPVGGAAGAAGGAAVAGAPAGGASNSSVPLRTCLVPYCEDQYVCWVTHDCYPGHGWKGVCAKCFPKLQTKRRGEEEARKCPGCNLFQRWDYVLPPR